MKYFQKTLYFIVKYRIHISCIFYFLLVNNNLRIISTINYHLILSLAFWHFSLFLFDRVYDRELDKLSQPDEYVKNKFSSLAYCFVGVFFSLSFIFFSFSGYKLIYWLILTPLTFIYPLEIIANFRIKQVFLIKNIFSALFVFCFPLLIQAYLLSSEQLNVNLLFNPLISLFIYVMIGEAFWDIRDCSVDKQFNIRTLPNTIGVRNTKIYIFFLIIIDSIITQNFFSSSAIIYFILIIFINENSNRLIFHFPPLIALLRFLI